jgi:hypothetical protein
MKLICHRGNIDKKIVEEENKPEKILFCISQGYDVEIDVWSIENKYFLGHDKPDYEINNSFLLENKNNLWCHAKNLNALYDMLKLNQLNCFWHQNDDYTLTSKGFIWTYPAKKLIQGSICVMPECFNYSFEEIKNCYGICSDNIKLYMG